jgi:recombination protein RecR
VVEGPREVEKLESSGAHVGLYHVLLEGFAPRDGVGPDPETLQSLRARVETQGVQEIVLATAPDREGEGAAMLVMEVLEGLDVKITRLARGVPVGTKLEYLHGEILAEAFRGRCRFESVANSQDG